MNTLKTKKQKRSLKDRVKNFFTIPEEVFEEEPSPQFERQKLFTLTRKNIFIGLALFLLIVNILVGFDLNIIYLRQILGFLFLVSVPGIILMLCFKIRDIGFWEYLVYTVGLSISFIMFAGLIVNWTLPALNITDKPLSLYPILICFDIFLIVLGIVAYKRNKDFKPRAFTVPKLDRLNNIFFTIPMIFPVLSILGAFLLNNHGSNILTMIMLGGIAVYILLLTIFRKRLDKNIWPWALYWMGLALLFMYSMRSWNIAGWDISLEYSIFKEIIQKSIWQISSYANSYNYMLSLTILPSTIDIYTNLEIQTFKLLIPIIFSLSSVVVYFLSKKLLGKIKSFLAGFLFMSQYQFFIFSSWARQEVALFFFGLIVLSFLSKDITSLHKKVLFLVFGLSMVVSHYSTSYIALALFILTYIVIQIYKIYEKRKIKRGKVNLSQNSRFYFTGILILLLFLFGFFWYSQVTPTSDGLISFADKSFSNIKNTFDKDVYSQGSSLYGQINLFNKEKYKLEELLQDYSSKIKEDYSNSELYDIKSSIKIANSEILSPNLFFYKKIIFAGEFYKKFFRIVALLGVLPLFFISNRKSILQIILIVLSCFLFSLILILPFSSINYNSLRLYQQFLFLLCVPAIVAFCYLLKIKKSNLILISILILIYFLLNCGFIYQLVGGYDPSVFLNNKGDNYNQIFSFREEYFGGQWFGKNIPQQSLIYSDSQATNKLILFGGLRRATFQDVLPETVDKRSYVYLNKLNVVQGKGFLPPNKFSRLSLKYTFPTEFLKGNKNKIYANGGSEIFK